MTTGKNKYCLGDVEFTGKVKTQTFKQFQLEQLIKSGAVIPASKLAAVKEQEHQRIRDFESAVVDEERRRRVVAPPPKNKLEHQPLTRERFEE
jgi:hypothetical protein